MYLKALSPILLTVNLQNALFSEVAAIALASMHIWQRALAQYNIQYESLGENTSILMEGEFREVP